MKRAKVTSRERSDDVRIPKKPKPAKQTSWETDAVRTAWRRIVKVGVLVGCVAGFLYQTTSFLKLYWTYPTVVDVQVTIPPSVDSPAFTFCNHNGIRLTAFCEKYPEDCTRNKTKICDVNFMNCFQGNRPRRPVEVFNWTTIQTLNGMEEVLDLCQPFSSLVFQCVFSIVGKWYKCKENNTLPWRGFNNFGFPVVCYTMNSRLGKPDIPPNKVSTSSSYRIALDLELMDYLTVDQFRSGQLEIHSPYQVPRAFADGVALKPGKVNFIYLKIVEKHLLPSPYSTNCTDYMKLWRENGGNGPVTQQLCVEYCKLRASLKTMGCVSLNVDHPSTENLCRNDTSHEMESITKECKMKCNPPCYSMYYDFQHDETAMPVFTDACNGGVELRSHCSRTTVFIMFNRMEVTTFAHKPRYESLEILSYVGGYIGIWLGISLMAVFDFLEAMIILVHLRLKRRKKRQQRLKAAFSKRNQRQFT